MSVISPLYTRPRLWIIALLVAVLVLTAIGGAEYIRSATEVQPVEAQAAPVLPWKSYQRYVGGTGTDYVRLNKGSRVHNGDDARMAMAWQSKFPGESLFGCRNGHHARTIECEIVREVEENWASQPPTEP